MEAPLLNKLLINYLFPRIETAIVPSRPLRCLWIENFNIGLRWDRFDLLKYLSVECLESFKSNGYPSGLEHYSDDEDSVDEYFDDEDSDDEDSDDEDSDDEDFDEELDGEDNIAGEIRVQTFKPFKNLVHLGDSHLDNAPALSSLLKLKYDHVSSWNFGQVNVSSLSFYYR